MWKKIDKVVTGVFAGVLYNTALACVCVRMRADTVAVRAPIVTNSLVAMRSLSPHT